MPMRTNPAPVGLFGLALLALSAVPGSAAESATPAATPEVIACDVAPRTVAGIAALAEPPPPGPQEPERLPLGHPADPATVAAVSAVVREFEACVNAGDQLRVLALFGDDLFRNSPASSPESLADLEAVAATPPTPQPPGRRAVVVGPWNVRQLEDGRVLAAILLAGENDPNPDPVHTKAVVFVQENGRWVIGRPFAESVWIDACRYPVLAVDLLGPPPGAPGDPSATPTAAAATPAAPQITCVDPRRDERGGKRERRRDRPTRVPAGSIERPPPGNDAG